MKKQRIYLDHAATTPLDPKVKKAMEPFWTKDFGNPSSIYKEGRDAKNAIEASREIIAGILNCRRDELIFTNGGTESDNLAIFGVTGSLGDRVSKSGRFGLQAEKPHIITTQIEHHAVLNSCKELEKQGWEVTYIGVGADGIVKPEDVKRAIKPSTVLVSIMYANNEIGSIQPIVEIGKIIKNYKKEKQSDFPYFHTDACQASGCLPLNIESLNVDLMTLNGSKAYGPKGIGVLFVKRNIRLKPLIYGGEQEKTMRPGTENVPAIVGLAEALKLAQKGRDKESARLTNLRDYFIKELTSKIPKVFLNGEAVKRLPNNVNVSVLGVEGEALVLYLDEAGVACSTGSACSSTSLEPSHVITAINKDPLYAHGSLRFSLGKSTDKKQVDYTIKALKAIVEKLRMISSVRV